MQFGKLDGMPEIALFGKSVRGASHIRTGKPCQDSHKIIVTPNAIILAAADGHGSSSCPHSKQGSQIAVNVFCNILSSYCNSYENNTDVLESLLNREGDTTIARAIDVEWKKRVEASYRKREARKKRASSDSTDNAKIWRQYGTTLLGLVIMPSFYFAFQLGDGDILLINDDGAEHSVVSEKLLGTETYSLSQPEAWKKAVSRVATTPGEDMRYTFMVATDGFSNSYPDDRAFLNTCMDYYATIKEHGAETVESNLKIWLDETSSMGSGDDMTVLFAYNIGR
jgi:serine/threonine protein phosphatase PrpC